MIRPMTEKEIIALLIENDWNLEVRFPFTFEDETEIITESIKGYSNRGNYNFIIDDGWFKSYNGLVKDSEYLSKDGTWKRFEVDGNKEQANA